MLRFGFANIQSYDNLPSNDKTTFEACVGNDFIITSYKNIFSL